MNGKASAVRPRGFRSEGGREMGGLNCNVPWSFAVVMILKTALLPVKVPLFGTKHWQKYVIPVKGKIHTKIENLD
jgi:hypothetical protein